MRLFDSHCHVDLAPFDQDRGAVLARAREAGVAEILVPAVTVEGWDPLLAVCDQHEGLWPALGIHPMFIDGHGEAELARLDLLLGQGRACAVGECGLDYFVSDPPKGQQRELFEAQLGLARDHDLPLVIHARRAEEAAWLMVRDYPGLRGVFHSFSGSY
jgi:TatD DNase family protein